jgi:D-sedoheptulose 7-phosphate isomerase
MIDEIIKAVKSGHKILIAGNGGLAAESEHFAAELTGEFAYKVYIPCIALCSNSSQLTALANDIGYDNVFSHLVRVLGNKGDVFIGMTTSKSMNILNACIAADSMGLNSVLLDGNVLAGKDTAEKQEFAIKHLHKLARMIKKEIHDSSGSQS